MDWLKRNLVTVAGLLLAFGAFAADLSGALPGDAGAKLATWSFVAVAAARGLVHAAQELSKTRSTTVSTTVVDRTSSDPLATPILPRVDEVN